MGLFDKPKPAPAPAPAAKPAPAPVRVEADTRVADAQRAIQVYWGTPGQQDTGFVAEALRKLSCQELQLVEAWVPSPPVTSSTGAKCARAREIVRGVIAEKE